MSCYTQHLQFKMETYPTHGGRCIHQHVHMICSCSCRMHEILVTAEISVCLSSVSHMTDMWPAETLHIILYMFL